MKHVYLGSMNDADPEDGWREGIARAGARPQDFAVREGVTAPMLAKLLAGNCIVARCVGSDGVRSACSWQSLDPG